LIMYFIRILWPYAPPTPPHTPAANINKLRTIPYCQCRALRTIVSQYRWMVWKMVPQTTSHALFEMTTVCLNTSFESCSPLVHHALLTLTPCLNQLLSRIDFFCISLGSAVTFLRWSGQICSQLMSSFLKSLCTKIIEIALFLTELFQK